jgi:tricorn protease
MTKIKYKPGCFLLLIFLMTTLNAAENSRQWMRYPALSPDGETIAFSYKGDLYRVPAKGGTAAILTLHAAYDFKPVWAPDGKTIAFASNRFGNFDVFIIPAEGGKAKRLTTHSNNEYPNSFTPDGKKILFSASIQDNPKNIQFPDTLFTELYAVPVTGGRPEQILSTPAVDAKYDKDTKRILYQDAKGYESYWRKHHVSAVTRDIWEYDPSTGKHTKLSPYKGEDLSPVYSPDGKAIYYLTEQFGTFNACKMNLSNPGTVTQVTFHEKHPVRFLTISDKGTLCYGFHGDIYTLKEGNEPFKVPILIETDGKENPVEFMSLNSGVTEMDVSPDGKEVVFIIRGEVFATSVDYTTTKRITNTPEQERSVSFSPDGKSILYASERNGSWNIYMTQRVREDETHFARATLLKEIPVLETSDETFEPRFSPDGKEIAFLEERSTLKVINLKTREVRTVVDPTHLYSYADGDQWFQWSPDSKWLLVSYITPKQTIPEVGLVDARGKQNIVNLTESGYEDTNPKWMMKGKMMIWASERNGMHTHGGFHAQKDVYGLFFTQEAYDRFMLNKEEYEALKEKEKKEKEEKEKKDKDKDKKKKDLEKEPEVEPVKIELDGIDERKVRLTINSSELSDAVLSPDGETLYYLSRFEEGYDLWINKLRENETKLVAKLKGRRSTLWLDKEGKNLFVFSDGKILKIDTSDYKQKSIGFSADFVLNREAERKYMFDHVWSQVLKKFYVKDLHGADWAYLKKEYSPFLPSIDNNYDFAEMLSEMLGELNASHTGARFRPEFPNGDSTARLGLFFDQSYTGSGLKVVEVIKRGPLDNAASKVKPGTVIEKIDGIEILPGMDYFGLLNHKAEKPVLLSLFDATSNIRWEETVKPVTDREEDELLYKRWVKGRADETEKLSGGRLGYVHIRSMSSQSYRKIFSEIFGKNYNKEALVIDSRSNGGGNLVEMLTALLTGVPYTEMVSRDQDLGPEPINRWVKPVVVIMGEDNYSDAHCFPCAIKSLGIGKLVGMPVAGTCTAVWWERMIDPEVIFGVPVMGIKNRDGKYLENLQLEPDYRVTNDPDVVVTGRDQQLEEAVKVMLEQLDSK